MSESTSIKELTKLNLLFGRISEVHVKNLQSFPFIYFNDLTEVKLAYDIATKREGFSSVTYDLIITKENDLLPKRFEALSTAVKAIFWEDISVKILINGIEVYKSE